MPEMVLIVRMEACTWEQNPHVLLYSVPLSMFSCEHRKIKR